MMLPTELAVVIVTWNVRDLALACLESVYQDAQSGAINVKVVVVDNASRDGTVDSIRDLFPQTTIIGSDENLGFARGNNAGIRALGTGYEIDFPPFVLFLNPDTVVRAGALRHLIGGMTESSAGLGGARLVYGDGSFQHSAFAFPGIVQLILDLFPAPAFLRESRINGRYPRRLYRARRPFQVDHPLGATFMVRREVIQQTGAFDEAFHLYCEEIDWAMRIRAANWKAVCIPSAEIVHFGGQSTSQAAPQSIINLWKARLTLYRKRYNPIKAALASQIVRAGMARLIRLAQDDLSLEMAAKAQIIDAYKQVIHLTHNRP